MLCLDNLWSYGMFDSGLYCLVYSPNVHDQRPGRLLFRLCGATESQSTQINAFTINVEHEWVWRDAENHIIPENNTPKPPEKELFLQLQASFFKVTVKSHALLSEFFTGFNRVWRSGWFCGSHLSDLIFHLYFVLWESILFYFGVNILNI